MATRERAFRILGSSPVALSLARDAAMQTLSGYLLQWSKPGSGIDILQRSDENGETHAVLQITRKMLLKHHPKYALDIHADRNEWGDVIGTGFKATLSYAGFTEVFLVVQAVNAQSHLAVNTVQQSQEPSFLGDVLAGLAGGIADVGQYGLDAAFYGTDRANRRMDIRDAIRRAEGH
jgi:hypothetical protein